MADDTHLSKLADITYWNKWRDENPTIVPDLRGAALRSVKLRGVNLSHAMLSHADFYWSDLRGADLSNAHLRGANLGKAYLKGARLSEAVLLSANFGSAILSEADLSSAQLGGSHFRETILTNTNFSKATCYACSFGAVDLSNALGLDMVEHWGPSSIGIDTLLQSKGRIPDTFLRGCGVPEDVITYLPSLCGKSLDFYSCFISHSTKDLKFCQRLRADLQTNNVRTWYFPEDATWGKSTWEEIDGSIKVYDKLVVVCSINSLRSSAVLREIERALQREDEERRAGHPKHILFPITLDDFVFNEWQYERKVDVLGRVVGMFKGWKSADRYNSAFDKLLRSLQTCEGDTNE